MEKTRQLATIEFIVRGKEGYYVCLEFKKVRESMLAVVKEMFQKTVDRISPILTTAAGVNASTVKDVKLILDVTREKKVKKVFKNVPLKNVIASEYAMIELQKEMLDKAVAL